MVRRCALACLVAGMAVIWSSADARLLIRNEDLDAHVADAGWCGSQIDLVVRAPDPGAFTGSTVALQQLIGGARAVLSFECPTARYIMVRGVSGGRVVRASIHRQPQRQVGIDGVEARLLQRVRADLLLDADAAPLLTEVNDYPAAGFTDQPHRVSQLIAAIAFDRRKHIPGNTLRM